MRGFAVVALHQPKSRPNVGGALRAAHVYGAAMVVLSGQRFERHPSNTTEAQRHIPLVRTYDVFDAIPHDCVPVAVEIIEHATSLPTYSHPERAFYIFGPEDGAVPSRVLDRCRDVVSVPTRYCMNLAATVNVVLYDRLAKGATP